jgi:hypothetical protein
LAFSPDLRRTAGPPGLVQDGERAEGGPSPLSRASVPSQRPLSGWRLDRSNLWAWSPQLPRRGASPDIPGSLCSCCLHSGWAEPPTPAWRWERWSERWSRCVGGPGAIRMRGLPPPVRPTRLLRCSGGAVGPGCGCRPQAVPDAPERASASQPRTRS